MQAVISTHTYTGQAPIDEDLPLVQQAKQGHAGAFEALYRKHYHKVFRIAKGVLLSSDDALDATQEVFTVAYRKLHMFDERCKFSTWLARLALNRCIQEGRKVFRYKRKEAQLIEATHISGNEPEIEDPKVTSSLAQLKPEDRAVLILFYWHELSIEEIAESMSSTPGAIKTRLSRARERFKNLYTEH